MRILPILAVLSLLLVAAPARSDGTGGDAPSNPYSAADLAPGTYPGRIGDGNDTADWYRVPHPAGKGVHANVTFENPGRYMLMVQTSNHTEVRNSFHTANQSVPVSLAATAAGDGSVLVGVTTPFGSPVVPVNYTLTIAFVEVADFAVTDLRVENVGLDTDQGPIRSGMHRRVEVDVANLGTAAASGHVRVTATTPSDGRVTAIGSAFLVLAPGQARTFAFTWDAVGLAGDVSVEARATTRPDGDLHNDAMVKSHYVLVGGSGEGVTPVVAFGACSPVIHPLCVAAQPTNGAANVTVFLPGSTTSAGARPHVSSTYGWANVQTSYGYAALDTYPTSSGNAVASCVSALGQARCGAVWLP